MLLNRRGTIFWVSHTATVLGVCVRGVAWWPLAFCYLASWVYNTAILEVSLLVAACWINFESSEAATHCCISSCIKFLGHFVWNKRGGSTHGRLLDNWAVVQGQFSGWTKFVALVCREGCSALMCELALLRSAIYARAVRTQNFPASHCSSGFSFNTCTMTARWVCVKLAQLNSASRNAGMRNKHKWYPVNSGNKLQWARCHIGEL